MTKYFVCLLRGCINFGIMSPDQIQRQANVHCVAKTLYNQDASRTPVPYGVLDKKLVSFINLISNILYFINSSGGIRAG